MCYPSVSWPGGNQTHEFPFVFTYLGVQKEVFLQVIFRQQAEALAGVQPKSCSYAVSVDPLKMGGGGGKYHF